MNEILFQFIWQYSLYNPQSLQTDKGEEVTIIHPGQRNRNAGPDFCEAKVKVGKTILVGNVELHIHSSDWQRHGHDADEAYSNVILHVVYRNDYRDNGRSIPVLELGPNIPHHVLNQYTYLIQTDTVVPCSKMLDKVNDLTKESWLSRLLAERLETKLEDWNDLLKGSAGDWRSLLYWCMAANFGFKVNSTAFLMLAKSLPINILAKHRDNLMQLEALLFGQAGFLEKDFEESYPQSLKEEYNYLRTKYKLQPMPVHLWKFLRMRPANFPTVRVAQFAMLIHRSVHLFSQMMECSSVEKIYPLIDVTASDYWDTHFHFGEEQKKAAPKHLGTASVQNIIINTVAPIQFLYAYHHGLTDKLEGALQLLEELPAETNNVITTWSNNGWKPTTAAQSQSLLHLFKHYCSGKRCLECSIGLSIVKSRPDK